MALGHELALPHSIGVCDGLIRVIDSGSETESCFSPQEGWRLFTPAVLRETLQADNTRLVFCEAEVLQGVHCEDLFCILMQIRRFISLSFPRLNKVRVCFFFEFCKGSPIKDLIRLTSRYK